MFGPAIFRQVESTATQWQTQTHQLNMRLERTSEPVWPEDEAAELAQPSVAATVPPLDDDEADAALRGVSVKLPDRLIPITARPADADPLGTLLIARGIAPAIPEFPQTIPGYDHVAFYVPTSFAAPDSLILRRIRLDLVLSGDGDVVPIAVFLKPEPDVEVIVHKVAEVSVDLGKLLTALVPQLPAVFTARAGGNVEVESIHPRIQATGLQRHECSWRVADSRMAYGFNPSLIAQFPAAHNLRVSARLHVEVRKQILGVFHKTYGKSASPVTYEYKPGQPLMTAFGYFARMKELGHEDDLYRGRLAGGSAMLRLGNLEGERDPGEAQAWYRRAADAGDIEAMLKLGQMLEDWDRREAGRWYQKAAASGSQQARKSLKRLYPWRHLFMRRRP